MIIYGKCYDEKLKIAENIQGENLTTVGKGPGVMVREVFPRK